MPKWLFPVIAAVLVIVAAGSIGFFFFRSSKGGADTPEQAVQNFVDAANDGDLLALTESVAPSELETLERFIDNAKENAVDGGYDESSGDPIFTVTIDVERLEEVERDENTAIVEAWGSAFFEDILIPGPLGDVFKPDLDVKFETLVEEDSEFETLPVTTVREDGRWYVSAVSTGADISSTKANLWLLDLGGLVK